MSSQATFTDSQKLPFLYDSYPHSYPSEVSMDAKDYVTDLIQSEIEMGSSATTSNFHSTNRTTATTLRPQPPRKKKTRKDRPGARRPKIPVSNLTLTEGFFHGKDITCGSEIWRGENLEEQLFQLENEQHEMAHYRREVANQASEAQRTRARELGRRRELRLARETQKQKENLAESAEEFIGSGDEVERPQRRISATNTEPRPSLGHQMLAQCSESMQESAAPQTGVAKTKSLFRRPSNISMSTEEPAPADALKRTRSQVGFAVSALQAGVPKDNNEEKQNKVLEKISLKLSKEERVKNLLKRTKTHTKMSREASRLQRLLETRKHEFAELPSEEQENLRNAYVINDRDGSGTLDHKELKRSLGMLGLKGQGDNEKKEVSLLCQEIAIVGDVDFYSFCFELVPRVRDKLKELRKGALFEQFCSYDADGSGLLDEDECQEIIGKMCQTNMDSQGFEDISKAGEELYETFKQAESGQVDFEGFQGLIGRVREKYQRVRIERENFVIEQKALTETEIQLHKEELLSLHETFSRQDQDGSGGLDEYEVVGALLEFGLVPREPESRNKFDIMTKDLAEAKGECGMDFHDFLWLIRQVRLECRKLASYELRKVFDRYDRDNSGNLDLKEVSMLIAEIGLQPRCREDQDEMKKLLQEVDEDGSGELDFEEFQTLQQKITEKLRSAQRRRENETARTLGFSQDQVSELRDAFFQLDDDGNGHLSIDECRQTLTLLRKNMTSEELNNLFDSIDRDGSGEIDFEEFLRFMRTIEDEDPEFFGDQVSHTATGGE